MGHAKRQTEYESAWNYTFNRTKIEIYEGYTYTHMHTTQTHIEQISRIGITEMEENGSMELEHYDGICIIRRCVLSCRAI